MVSALDVILASPLGFGLALIVRVFWVSALVTLILHVLVGLAQVILLLRRELLIVLVLLLLVSHRHWHHSWLSIMLHHVWVHWHMVLVVHRNLRTNIKVGGVYMFYTNFVNFFPSLRFYTPSSAPGVQIALFIIIIINGTII